MAQWFALSGRSWPVWVLTIIAFVFFFFMQGLAKLMAVEASVTAWETWGYPTWMMYAVGAVELVGAAMLLVKRTAFIGAVALLVIMPGAAVTHMLAGQWALVALPIVTGIVLASIAWMQMPDWIETRWVRRTGTAPTAGDTDAPTRES